MRRLDHTRLAKSIPRPLPFFSSLLGNELVLFSGTNTWTWNGTTWSQWNVQGPPSRGGAMMAPLNGVLVLFGGQPPSPANAPDLSDTWTWDGVAWKQLSVTGPPGRHGAFLGPLNGKLVLFGGTTAPDSGISSVAQYLSDTWTWDGATWSQLNVSGPTPRCCGAMAPLNGKLVLFRGSGALSGGPPGMATVLSDIWIWDGAAWTQQKGGPPDSTEFFLETLP